MRLKITHRTDYGYSSPVAYALQRIRLTPPSGYCQDVPAWSITLEGAAEEVRYRDLFGNETRLLSASGDAHTISVTASGEVDTRDTNGLAGPHTGFAPLWLLQAPTDLTAPGDAVKDLAGSVSGGNDLERLHRLMGVIGERVAYTVGSTTAMTTAEQALVQRQGVCQDHAHIFAAAARLMGYPACYVSGYLKLDDRADQVATHAWAEAYVDGLGWVSFDPSNGISTDERYVRVAWGRDYRDAMPISGITFGQPDERLEVNITVEQYSPPQTGGQNQ